jgi:hypothetical protein
VAAKRPNIAGYAPVSFPLPYSAPRIPTRPFPSLLGCTGCSKRGLGGLGTTIYLDPKCIESGKTVAECLGIPLPKPGTIQPTQPRLPTTLDPYKPLPLPASGFSVPRDSPLLLAPAAITSWLDQELIAGVSNKVLAGAGVGIVLLASLRKGRRR